MTLSVSYGPNQGLELAVPKLSFLKKCILFKEGPGTIDPPATASIRSSVSTLRTTCSKCIAQRKIE